MRIGFFASGEGATMQAIADACRSGRVSAEPALLVHNNSDAGCVRRARALDIPTRHLSARTHPDPGRLDAAILAELEEHRIDVVMLCGYMKKLGATVLAGFRGPILNTHPALLPAFGGQGMFGDRVHEAVLATGVVETGATVHLVDAEYDVGPILAQRAVQVIPGDTPGSLGERVRSIEVDLCIEVLGQLASSLAQWPP